MKSKVKNIKNNLVKFGTGLLMAVMGVAYPVSAFASEEGTTAGEGSTGVADFLKDGDANGGIFAPLIEKIKGLGQDGYQLIMIVGIVLFVISGAILGISIASTKNSQKQTENKSWAVSIAVGACILFGAVTIVGLIGNIASGF